MTKIEHPLLSKRGVSLWLKRDDLIHPVVSGNKYRKLIGHLTPFRKSGKKYIQTVGGAYSNHLVATAAYAQIMGIQSVGLVKYHDIDLENPTIQACISFDMKLRAIGRNEVKNFIDQDAYFIPEGAADEKGILGMQGLVDEVKSIFDPDYWAVSVGMGGTINGISHYAPEDQILGFSSFTKSSYRDIWNENDGIFGENVHWFDLGEQLGGFGGYREEIMDFVWFFYNQTGVLLDPIYTSKSMWALWKLLKNNEVFKAGDQIVFIHTGGLQGWDGFARRFDRS